MRFYFHLHECGTVLEDEEGAELDSLADARACALVAARQIMCEELANGELCLGCYIMIEDAERRPLLRLRFREAVKIVGI